ncbi:hypothetical protein LQZ24_04050 [Fructobacillus sp. M1-13]|uniref:Uncharacterized protein n=1 Tax=Fructobacillus papyriferae TaxID=2713171 RepID=A0ABS5QPM5_9LACO|nr:hypothetical protein [Fructobacillus papyriferae]MBS9335134.1 hypothetical protein [Fructobacillus papyriferae]MCD2159196.1 hypothetical protein [Fructobacillus papyriferae]
MKITTVYTAIAALVLLFISVSSWVFGAVDVALVTSNLTTVMLLIVYLWNNRNNRKD